ncbi:MAG: hypothetical protein P8171_23115, partial [Candidatus Thiodiazotropha sp.]
MKKSLLFRARRFRALPGHSNAFLPARPCLRRRLAALLLGAAMLCGTLPAIAADEDSAWQPLPYQLGQGLNFPQQGLRIGGYSSVHLYHIDPQPTTLSVQDISLILTKDFGTRWQLFTEMEIGDALNINEDETTTDNADFDVERLYADYRAYQGITLRFGKFLTPVGRWNLIHADPLVWTVSRPLTTSAAFSRHATGAMMYGIVPAAGNDLDYWMFVDNSEQLDPSEKEEHAFDNDGADPELKNNFERAAGLRVQYHLYDDRLSLGASYLDYSLQEPEQQYRLAGLDFSWSGDYVNLSGEAIYRKAEDDNIEDENGAFLQAVIPLPHHFYFVGRHEQYKSAYLPKRAIINTTGFNYRPQPALAFKLE